MSPGQGICSRLASRRHVLRSFGKRLGGNDEKIIIPMGMNAMKPSEKYHCSSFPILRPIVIAG